MPPIPTTEEPEIMDATTEAPDAEVSETPIVPNNITITNDQAKAFGLGDAKSGDTFTATIKITNSAPETGTEFEIQDASIQGNGDADEPSDGVRPPKQKTMSPEALGVMGDYQP